MSTVPSMIDRPFGCPPDKPLSAKDFTCAECGGQKPVDNCPRCVNCEFIRSDKPRCSCGSKLKTVGTVDGERKCGQCFRKSMREIAQRNLHKLPQRSKYGAVRTEVDGITFASKGEARRYKQLKLLEKAGYIRNLELQPKYEIKINGKHVCNVVLDFRYFEGATRQLEDFKGKDTALSRLKRKMVEACFPGTKIKVVR